MGTIRLLLAICVVMFHVDAGVIPRFLHSSLAVQCFYIISGFLVQFVIFNYRERGGANWKSNFYLSRALRLFPLYWLFTLLVFIFIGHTMWDGLVQQQEWLGIGIFLFNNIFILGQDILRLLSYDHGNFAWLPAHAVDQQGAIARSALIGNALTIKGQSWSLAVELLFYLLAPFVLLRKAKVLIIIVALSIACRVILASAGYKYHSFINAVFFNEIGIFLYGALACRVYLKYLASGAYSMVLSDKTMHRIGMAVLVLTLLYYYKGWREFPAGGTWNGGLFGVPDGWWGAIIVTGLALPFLFHTFRNNRIDRFLGDLSYPIYISHMFIGALVARTAIAAEWRIVWVIVISVIVSVILVYAIERPTDRWRHRWFLHKSR